MFTLQRFAEVLLPRLLESVQAYADARFLLLCTHRTHSVLGKHVPGEVPFLFLPRRGVSRADEFHEAAAQTVGVKVDRACELARWLLDMEVPISGNGRLLWRQHYLEGEKDGRRKVKRSQGR